MSFRRVGRLAAIVLPTLLCLSCGQVYRPVVIPTSTTPPTPANFHAVFGISNNVPFNTGGAMQIDVAGDSILAETPNSDPKFGENPTHAAIFPNNGRLFVASAGSIYSGDVDKVSFFTPSFQGSSGTGFGAVSSVSLPSQTSNISAISEGGGNAVTVTLSAPLNNVAAGSAIVIAGSPIAGYNGTFALTVVSGTTLQYVASTGGLAPSSGGTVSVPPQPVFLNTTQNNAMYVANYNSNSVFAINTTQNVVSNTATVGTNPVTLAETPNGSKLYVANQGGNSVSSLNVTDLSSNVVRVSTGATFSGTNPVWVTARGDSQKVYVLTQGDGQLVTIDTATDTVTSSIPVGIGANFIFYDPHLNRLYVTNPSTNMVYVLSDTGGANDTPSLLTATPLAISGLSATTMPACPTCGAPVPVSVTALADGSRFYVASYQLASSCPDGFVGSSACMIPGLAVFDANNFTLKANLTLLTDPPFAADTANNQYQYAVPPVTSCAPAALYSPASTRFRMFTAAAVGSSRVYVSICDAGVIAVINTTDDNANNTGGGGTPADTLVTDLPMAFSAGPIQSNGEPANQIPIFLLPGQ